MRPRRIALTGDLADLARAVGTDAVMVRAHDVYGWPDIYVGDNLVAALTDAQRERILDAAHALGRDDAVVITDADYEHAKDTERRPGRVLHSKNYGGYRRMRMGQ